MAAAPRIDIDMAATIGRAIDSLQAGRSTREVAITSIAATVAAALRERTAAERTAVEATELLVEFDRLGGGRDAAGKVARRFASDPLARETLARRVRRLVQKRKADNVRLVGRS
ncbi:MAG: hypothetical protein JWR80_8106 [Bradyrhizobium sp.]|nr:hypothetical protein [Bradyrhizobium sp.]